MVFRHKHGNLSIVLVSATVILAVALCASVARAQDKPPRFEVAPVFSTYHAPDYLVSTQYELGGRFTWNWLPHLSLEGEYDSTLKSPIDATDFEGGYFSQALFGVKSGIRRKTWGVFGTFRPGFIHYTEAIASVSSSPSITFTRAPLRDAAYDLGGGAEFFISRHWLFRYDAGVLFVHEGKRSFEFNAQPATLASFTTKNNFESQISVAFRF